MSAVTLASPTSAAFPVVDPIYSQFEQILSEVPSTHFFAVANMRKLLDKYTPDELRLIYRDFCELREKTFADVSKAKDYVVTAGGPSAGKSTVLENIVAGEDIPADTLDPHLKRAYIDPDRSCLLHMKHTYLADRTSGKRNAQEAYEHWREASNFLSNVYLAVALKEGYAIAHGSTMATPYAKNALSAIQNGYGYRTTVVHMTCAEDIRRLSEERRRAGGIVQVTDKDFIDKQALFLTLLPDYLKFANQVLFCYRSTYETSTWAAKVESQQVTIYNDEALQKIQKVHDQVQGEGFWQRNFPPVASS